MNLCLTFWGQFKGNITSYVYDAYGQVIKKTNPDGTMNLTAYDGLQREKATYFLGSENGTKQILTKTSYEFAGYNFDIYSALDTSASHSCKGLKTTKTTYITENKQVISETLTDIKEHTIYEKTNGETKRTSAYYANGQLARQTDALGNITKYEYGYLNKVTKTYTPFNTKSNGSVNYSVTENQYDKNGNVTLAKQTVQKQDSDTVKYSVTENQYNAQGLLTQVTLSDGTSNGEKNITKYFYNNASIQTKMYTGLNSTNDSDYMTTNYEYDAWGHLVRTTDSTGYNSGATTYDLNGNALTVTDANGNVTTNTYDALNRVLTANTICSDTSKNVSKSYVYDNMGRVRSKTANGVQTSYQYDIFGRVYQELSPKSFKGYFYEGVSQYAKEQLVGINHQTMYSSTQYEYDAEMRIAQVKESGNLTATYTYDANGNKVSETLANGVVSTYSYNGCNKVTKLVTKSGNSDISSYEYSYYLDGSDACKVRNENGTIETTSYDYDGLKRLTRESISNGKTADTYSYEYDDYGNRSKMVANGSEEYETVYDYTVNGKYTALLQKEIKTVEETSNATISDGLAISPTDLITSTAADAKTEETAYSYDANGNQITKTAEGKTETNTYDGLNQLIGFTDGETTASYKYNADGLRTSKTVDGKTINHIWDGNKQIVVDMDDSDWYSAEVYVRGTNLLAKFSKQSGNVKTDYQYYTQNAHGDVVNLTDSTGTVAKSYKYDAFGVEQNVDDADDNAFRYCGEYFDAETGTIYLRARYYNPTIGRFISRDSVTGEKTDPLSLNLYTYCHNTPIIGTDPSGHVLVVDDIILITIGVLLVADVALLSYSASTSYGNSFSDPFSVPNFNDPWTLPNDPWALPGNDVLDPPISFAVPDVVDIPQDEAIDDVKDKTYDLPEDTVIYRYGGTAPSNLTPRPKDRTSGLSFVLTKPTGRDYVETTVSAINSSGYLIAIRDGANHVSVVPNPAVGTLDEWIETGSSHPCTQVLKSRVVKHKKGT